MSGFWSDLSKREQVAIILCCLSIGMFLIWFIVIRPLSSDKDAAAAAVALEQDRLARIEALAAALPASDNKAQNNRETGLRQAVSDASARAGVSISRIQPDADGLLLFQIERTSTAELTGWLMILEQDFGFRPAKVRLSANDGDTTIAATLSFPDPSGDTS